MSFKNSRTFYIGLICILVGGGCLLFIFWKRAEMSDRVLNSRTSTSTASEQNTSFSEVSGIQFEIVTSQAAQERGLGGRAVISDNYAMLFDFPSDQEPGFWMKDMLASIDIIWLTDNGTIVSINQSVSPQTYPSVFYPPQPIRYVLETRAGFAAQKGWVVGTKVALPAL
jgi:uncharacterized membrane protein (UPF0127 family)